MDQKLPDSELKIKPGKVFVNLTKSHLPGSSDTFYYGSPCKGNTLTIEDIAARISERGTSYRTQTLVEIYRIMTDEIYDALERGSAMKPLPCPTTACPPDTTAPSSSTVTISNWQAMPPK